MRKVLRCLFLCCLLAGATGLSPSAVPDERDDKQQGMATLYDDGALKYWASLYRKGLDTNFREVILPHLTQREREKLSSIRIDAPLRVPESDPMTYMIMGPPWVIRFSVLSLKFFDDICIARAWLEVNGYSTETISEYIAMLKYHVPADLGGSYPAPLDALQIPANAEDDQRVFRLARRLFDEAIFFVLLHELGHAWHQDPGYGPKVDREEARAHEAAADAFALDLMIRIGAEPTSMAFFFMTSAPFQPSRGDFENDVAYEAYLAQATHPLSVERLETLAITLEQFAPLFAIDDPDPRASRIRIKGVAAQFRQMATTLGTYSSQKRMAQLGRTTTLAMLAPRHVSRHQELPESGSVQPARDRAYDGTFLGELADDTTSIRTQLVLRRSADQVVGEYHYTGGSGSLVGVIQEGVLYFQWTEDGKGGYGYLVAESEGRVVSGHWGRGESMDNGGTWLGARTE